MVANALQKIPVLAPNIFQEIHAARVLMDTGEKIVVPNVLVVQMNRVSNMELVTMELMAQANVHARKDGKEKSVTMIRVVVVTLQIAHYVGVRLGHIAVLVRVNVFVLNFNVKNWRLRFTSKQKANK